MWKIEVKYLLQQTDIVALRFFKAGLPFPQEWKDYTNALRSLLHQDEEPQTFPLMPEHTPDT